MGRCGCDTPSARHTLPFQVPSPYLRTFESAIGALLRDRKQQAYRRFPKQIVGRHEWLAPALKRRAPKKGGRFCKDGGGGGGLARHAPLRGCKNRKAGSQAAR